MRERRSEQGSGSFSADTQNRQPPDQNRAIHFAITAKSVYLDSNPDPLTKPPFVQKEQSPNTSPKTCSSATGAIFYPPKIPLTNPNLQPVLFCLNLVFCLNLDSLPTHRNSMSRKHRSSWRSQKQPFAGSGSDSPIPQFRASA